MMRVLYTLLLLVVCTLGASGQTTGLSKLSPWLRQMAADNRTRTEQPAREALAPQFARQANQRMVCAFIRLTDDATLGEYGARSLAKVGNIHVANIPVNSLSAMAADKRVLRMEARPMGNILLDTVSHCINAVPVHQGYNIPQAYTGEGVVVGVMDIGFDLTHPTFYDRSMSNYRIKCLWDMLSNDTIGSSFPVGRDYVGKETLLELGHSRDGLDQAHGTHTVGIAAGSGYDSPYQGLAPNADICLVANAVSDNAALIDSALYDRFTFATDALGFKYLFDYAKRVNKPCVVSFSEGSSQDFWGYDQLYYEMLDSLVGPGRILVAAAGNQGNVKSWFRKESGTASMGSFLLGSSRMYCTLKSADAFEIRLVAYGTERNDTLTVPATEVWAANDSLLSLSSFPAFDSLQVQAYPSCYNPKEVCYDLMFYANKKIGYDAPLSIELLGNDADVELWRGSVALTTNDRNPQLCAGETIRNVHSPSSAPRVISVGATSYRDSILNVNGQWKSYHLGPHGRRIGFSSVGPTADGRIKPDVVAPGNNIISSYSSFYLEHHPNAGDIKWDVAEFPFNGRTYAWNSNSGTSMSCPAVAGAIALWLQAKPDLTPEDVIELLSRTCRQPDPSLSYPNNEYGYGEIDVYSGLLSILHVDRINEVADYHTPAKVALRNRQLLISLSQPTEQPVKVRMFSLNGHEVFSTQLPQGDTHYSVALPSLPAAIYAVQLDGYKKVNGSTLVMMGSGF